MRPLLALLLLAAATRAEEPRLICLGDSLTAGLGVAQEQAWPALLERRLAEEGLAWRVVNAGVSGDTSAGGLARLGWLLRQRPRALFVCLGANDGLRGLSTEALARNLDAILSQAQAAGVAPFLAGMRVPVNLHADRGAAFAAVFPAVAEARGVPLLPFLLEGVGLEPAYNQPDGIHPNAQGHARIAATVAAFLIPRLRELAP